MANDLMEAESRGSADADRGGSVGDYIRVRDLTVAYGTHTVISGLSFDVQKGSQLALLGPSGCGKTTTLRCLAGLETPTSGEISINGETVFSSSKGINMSPDKRRLSLMFQSYAIWPHMTVGENVGYPLRMHKVNRARARERVDEMLELVNMAGFAATPATELSGGQQQRVALARSYAYPPTVLLLDEPLSNLDARLRDQVRRELVSIQRSTGITGIFVTHDQGEAMSVSDRIIVMDEGRIVQDGSPIEIYHSPNSKFVADFIGAANIIEGVLERDAKGGSVRINDEASVRIPKSVVDEALSGGSVGRRVSLCCRTIFPRLRKSMPSDLDNVWACEVVEAVILGDTIDVRIAWPGGTLRQRMLATQEPPREGEAMLVHIPPDRLVLLED
jgi:iron(III) transport system ATP-binding protein